MAWKVEIDKDAQRYLAKLDKPIARSIVAKLRQISKLNDPRMQGKGLTGNLAGLWRISTRQLTKSDVSAIGKPRQLCV